MPQLDALQQAPSTHEAVTQVCVAGVHESPADWHLSAAIGSCALVIAWQTPVVPHFWQPSQEDTRQHTPSVHDRLSHSLELLHEAPSGFGLATVTVAPAPA
jgi:hypothetical protein